MKCELDALVVGLGVMGSAICHALARRGLAVLGLEQFEPLHSLGSSHGQTRIIRRAYFEHPDYVPLLNRAYELWSDLERTSGQKLFERVGLLMVGGPQSQLISGAKRSAALHGLAVEPLNASSMARQFPMFRTRGDQECLFERDAGFLHAEVCVEALAQGAERRGAVLRYQQPVIRWSADGEHVMVETATDRWSARRLVLSAGPWAGRLLRDWNVPLTVKRKPVFWFPSLHRSWDRRHRATVFAFEVESGFFYGFPALEDGLVKAAQHDGGLTVSDLEGVNRRTDDADLEPIRSFIHGHLNGLADAPQKSSVCLYTMTPDQHVILDRHPQRANVFVACGFSGHGFKFAPVIGEAVADWVEQGQTDLPIAFLSRSRPALAAPSP